MLKQFNLALVSLALALCSVAPCRAEEAVSDQAVLFRGRVLDDYNDKPIAGAAVTVSWATAELLPGASRSGAIVVVSDQTGRFEVPQAAVPVVPHSRRGLEGQCIAPGYGFERYAARPGDDVTVTLRARSRMHHHQCLYSHYLAYVDQERVPELTRQVNETRAQMGLAPLDLHTGELAGTPVSCPEEKPTNQWGPFTGRVVDKHTEQPIPGAICVVSWERAIPFVVHDIEQFDDARVAVADRDGRFEIPRRLTLLGVFTRPPGLTCMAPGYERYVDSPDEGPIEARLRPLTAEGRRSGKRDLSVYGMFPPDEKRKELETFINDKRRELGLGPVELSW